MQAMVLEEGAHRLVERDLPRPEPKAGEILVRVLACGVCRTDLHIVDGELVPPRWPVIPGHEVVGEVAGLGEGTTGFEIGDRVGLAWLAGSDGECEYCRRGEENLCPNAAFTGFARPGGYAEYTTARADFAYQLPADADPVATAPLLCAGLIGYRTWRKAGGGERIGLYGFGAAAHILAQLLVREGKIVYAFTRPGDTTSQAFARRLGAAWAGGSDEKPPESLDAALIFAPVGALVPAALEAVRPGGRVVSGGIHMSDIPAFPYRLLWEERSVASVANLTRADGREFLALAAKHPIHTTTKRYPLGSANEALDDLRAGRLEGAAVLVPDL
ncbi:MAG TPA: zinc-dependent alcohol dehydrogenase family protein [Gammaproteobacteria bacterium]|nr:zinc-dependent alcohol dehydrogenase family protein [Gammaproteobacteria bacterium]